ncbi:MAG: GNAT family N-acetyltransferase [Fimbriimonadaceae bacterium]|nr:GNAT family N-acetyltransferase [Fimbriimonadaceae bacterium]
MTVDPLALAPTTLTAACAKAWIDDLLTLEQTLRATAGETYAPEGWTAGQFLSERPAKWQLSQVIRTDQALLAFVIASAPDPATGHLHRVGVRPDCQRHGLFRRCCGATVAAARELGLQRLTCTLTAANTRMAAALEQLGWQRFDAAGLTDFAAAHGFSVAQDELWTAAGRFQARWLPLR